MSGMGKPGDQQAWRYNATGDTWAGHELVPAFFRAGVGPPNALDFVQGTSTALNIASTAQNVIAGDLMVVFIQSEGAVTPTGVVDNLGTAYSLVTSSFGNTGGIQAAVFAGTLPSSGPCAVTGTWSGATSFQRCTVAEFRGAKTTVDFVTGNYAISSLNVTITTANSLVLGLVAGFHSAVTYTPGTAMTSSVVGTGSDSSFIEYTNTNNPGTRAVAYSASAGIDHAPFFAVVFEAKSGISSAGVDGDMYIDVTSKSVWGPRTNGIYARLGSLGA